MNYIFDKYKNIYTRPQKQNFAYSDGDDIENYILETLKKAKDVSCLSQELFSYIKDWPSLYHLSPQRFSLLRPFKKLFHGKSVLEIGSGCGAITRGLAESGANVVALEGSQRRAQICAERCRGQNNVKVFCDNFQNFEIEEKFDVVTLIGVLEYSCMFIDSVEPVLDVLRKARSFLKGDGVLIVAIENKLGIKYFNGAPEDHLSIPFSSIQNLYSNDGPVTFGKKELELKIQEAGFPEVEIHYPFPDYKLPNVVLHPTAFNCADFKIDSLLLGATSTFDSGFYNQCFSEAMAFESLFQNQLLEDLANSFLVFTKKDVLDKNELANAYSVKRQKPYAKTIKFCLDEGKIMVRQCRLFPEESTENDLFEYCMNPTEEYITGELLIRDFHRLVNTNAWSIEQLVSLFREWLDYIAGGEFDPKNVDQTVNPVFFDCLPFNIIRSKSGLVAFDLEYRLKVPLEFKYIAFRGILQTLAIIQPAPILNAPKNLLEFTKLIMNRLGIFVSTDDIKKFLDFEFSIVSQILFMKFDKNEYVSDIQEIVLSINRLDQKVAFLEHKSNCLEQDYSNLMQSKKWRCLVMISKIINAIPFNHVLKKIVRKSFLISTGFIKHLKQVHSKKKTRRFVDRFQGAVLIVDHDLGGGANHYRNRAVDDFITDEQSFILLNNKVVCGKHQFYEIKGFDKKGKSILKIDSLESVFVILDKVTISEAIYNSLVYYPNVLDLVRKMLYWADQGVLLKVLIHDFFPICPSYNLVAHKVVCSVVENGLCTDCLAYTDLQHIQGNCDIKEWQIEWGELLSKASEIICFSPSSEKILCLAYPDLFIEKIKTIPHSMDYFKVRKPVLRKGVCPCIGIVGNICNISKGVEIVSLLAEHLLESRPEIKIVIIGDYSGSSFSNIEVTGQYKTENLSGILEKNGVNIVLFPSVWPETFSYIMSELILLDVPVVCFDLGAQAEKTREYYKGLIIPEITPESTFFSIEQLYNKVYSEDLK